MSGSIELPRPASVDSLLSNDSKTSLVKAFVSDKLAIGEDVKISIDTAFERFRLSEDKKGKHLFCV